MLPILFIIIGSIIRLLPHQPNIAPITAMALFGGVYLGKKYALFLPLVVMLITDFFLGFHRTMIFVYLSFFLIGLIGLWLKNHKKIQWIFLTTCLSSIIFFIVTNLGVWILGWYPPTLAGLELCYIKALPFFRNTLIGDFGYVGIMFGFYELLNWVFQVKKFRLYPLKNLIK